MGTRSDVRSRTPSGACHGSRRPRIGRRCCEHPSACHPRYFSKPLRLLQYQCFSRFVALYPDSPLFARSQPPHLGSSVGDFMRSSVPERRCLSPRSNSVPGILTPLSASTPLHRIVTVGRSNSHECGSRGCFVSPASNHSTSSREDAPATRSVSPLQQFSQAASGCQRRPTLFPGLWSVEQEAEAQVAVSLIVVVFIILTAFFIVYVLHLFMRSGCHRSSRRDGPFSLFVVGLE
jgi:hypothetical protein